MSKFIDAIREQWHGIIKPVKGPISASVSPKQHNAGMVREYEIEVVWRRVVYVEPRHIQPMIDNCVGELREDIYGEIKNRIFRLERAIYEQDHDTAISEMRDIKREIFG